MTSHAVVLAALADPTRRVIIERIKAGPRSVEEIARGLPMSRPAVSQHLRVLRESGLATERRAGRRRLYRLEPAGLEPVRRYVEGLWEEVLSAYQSAAEKEAADVG